MTKKTGKAVKKTAPPKAPAAAKPKPAAVARKKPAAPAKKKPPAVAAAAVTPREGTKLARVLEMLKRPDGTTVLEIMDAMEWQVHTTRALLSAGGAFTKKFGIAVEIELVKGERRYKVAA